MISRILERLEEYKYSHLVEHDSESIEHCKGKEEYCEGSDCFLCLWDKAIEIVQEVAKEYGNGWIPVEVAMPEEHESIFAKYKGTSKWDENGMFEKISDEVYATVENMKTGESTTTHAHTTDGKWSCDLLRWNDTYRIIAWMPLPPKYEPKDAPYKKGE